MAERRPIKRKELLLSMLVEEMGAGTFQKRPYFPDMLHQPDLLVVPEAGKIAAVSLYEFGKRISWRSALAAMEDLFEVKLYIGPHTVAIGVSISDSTDTHIKHGFWGM